MLRGLDAQTAVDLRRRNDGRVVGEVHIAGPDPDERGRQRRLGDADDAPGRLTALDVEHDLVAHADVRLIRQHVGVQHDRALIIRAEPASLDDGGPEQAGSPGWRVELEAGAFTPIRTNTARVAATPELRCRDARYSHRLALDGSSVISAIEVHPDVVVQVRRRLVERGQQGGTHSEDGDENRPAESERREGEQQSHLAPNGVAHREQHRTRQAAYTLQHPIDVTAAELVAAGAVEGECLPNGDADAGDDREQGRCQRYQQADRDLERDHLQRDPEATEIEVDQSRKVASDPVGDDRGKRYREGQ